MPPQVSADYKHLLQLGAFAGTIDPWAEAGKYFHQLHANLIGLLQDTLQPDLLDRGYYAGRETSLQIAENRSPDLFVLRQTVASSPPITWDYAATAAALRVEPGVLVGQNLPELDAVYIREMSNGELVTIVEIISPRNKTDHYAMQEYSAFRECKTHQQGINIVEIDLTRSMKRLLRDDLTSQVPYHIAIYLPQTAPRVITLEFGHPMKSFALPLRQDALAVHLQTLYDKAYYQGAIALQIQQQTHYRIIELPFPSLLTEQQKQTAIAKVAAWETQLATLQTSS
jgi:hypothetical protein